MKLIKFIAAAALVASTSLVSGGSAASTVGLKQDVARACPDWPHCREVEVSDLNNEVKPQVGRMENYRFILSNGTSSTEKLQAVARACPDWPHCREVEFAEQTIDTSLIQAEVVRKTA